MTRRIGQFRPTYVSTRVPRMTGLGGIEGDDLFRVEYGAPPAANNTGFLNAQSIATAGGADIALTLTRLTAMAPFGRTLRVVASAAATSFVRIIGRDYLNQRMIEERNLNGTTPVLYTKAFRFVDRIEWGATSSVTIDVGWRDALGVPFRSFLMIAETKNGALSANAGTFTAGLAAGTAPTASNADVRGTYLPVTVIPDGTNTFGITVLVDRTNLHGVAQFGST